MTDFCLEDNKIDNADIIKIFGEPVFKEEDIKQAIKLLKEVLKDNNLEDPRQFMISQKWVLDEIDKIFGKGLAE